MPTQVDYDPFADEAPKGGTPVDYDPFAEGPSMKDRLKRQAGLTARHAVTGVMGLPSMVGDAANALVNLPIMASNRFLGTDIPRVPSMSGSVQSLMTDAGLPAPESTSERLAGIGSSALMGAGAAKTAATKLSEAAPRAAREIFGLLGEAPKLQAAGAIAGGAATEVAQSAGMENPYALMGVGMVGSVLPGGATTAATRTGSAVAQAVKPFMQRGKEQIVGEALNRVATNPTAAATRMGNAGVLVPGSRPMVPEVAQDAGLINADSAVRGLDQTGIIPQRKSEQNAARQAEMDRIAGDEATLARATAKRDRTFDQMGEPAFENAGPVNIGREWINNPVLRTIREIRESPQGARQTVRDALDEAEAQLTQEGVDLTNARVLYEIRKDLDLLRTGKLSGAGKSGRERSNMGTAESQLSRVISSLDQTIESGASGYRDYMRMFAKRSVPVEQLKALQSLRERAVTAAPDPLTKEHVLSQAKFTQLLRNNLAPNPNYNRAPLNGQGPGRAQLRATVPGTREPVLANLSEQHVRVLDRIAQDLDRGAATTATTMKVGGSDTFKNMSVAAVIGRVLGDKTGEYVASTPAFKTATGGKLNPLAWMYRVPDQDIQLLMLEAWTDPQLAARLMRQATRAEIEGVATELGRRAAQQSAASALYGGE